MVKKVCLCLLFMSFSIAFTCGISLAYEASTGPTGVLVYNKEKAYNGYTLFAPNYSNTVYLINMEGYIVHKWETDYDGYAELLENGNILRMVTLYDECPDNPHFLKSGRVQEVDWKGNIVWEYTDCDADSTSHHAFHRMPNGNTLILVWEHHTKEEAEALGRLPDTLYNQNFPVPGLRGIWSDKIVEVNRKGEVVWEWRVWDHIGPGEKEFDLNYFLPELYPSTTGWTHFNSVGYSKEKDIVIANSRMFSEIYLINHKTGELINRHGNPCTHGAGECPSWLNDGDQEFFFPHASQFIKKGIPGEGNILLFDNGRRRQSSNNTSIAKELDPDTFDVVWEYGTKSYHSFYSENQGYVQRLPNGNTLLVGTNGGHLIEVTTDGEIVWEFVSPAFGEIISCTYRDSDDHVLPGGASYNQMFRAFRYGRDYPGLKRKKLSHKEPFNENCPKPPYKTPLYRNLEE